MKESGMDIVLLRPYWEYMKKKYKTYKTDKKPWDEAVA